MKRNKFLIQIFFLLFFLNINAQDAKKIFLDNLTVFENLQKDENASVDLNTLYEAREFLIKTTGITYEMEKPFDMPVFPPNKTVEDWRNWFEKNKEKLYLDKKSKKVKVKN